RGRHRIDACRTGTPVAQAVSQTGCRRLSVRQPCTRKHPLMEIVLAIAIGVLAGSGIWLLLRPRTFQVIMGLTLIAYAVNLFIFAMGRVTLGAPPVIHTGWAAD